MDELLAAISEEACRYFCGWRPKEYGERRHEPFERRVRALLEEHDSGS